MCLLTKTAPKNLDLFLSDYFDGVSRGKHVVNRDFEYSRSTRWNAKCLAHHIAQLMPLPNGRELISLICSNVPDGLFSMIDAQTDESVIADFVYSHPEVYFKKCE